MYNIALVGVCGMFGVFCRYGIDKILGFTSQSFPWSTILINILGSFLAGLIYVLVERQEISNSFGVILLVGFCGGFTTFSAYTIQAILLFEKNKSLLALSYFILSPTLALLAAYLPIFFLRRMS